MSKLLLVRHAHRDTSDKSADNGLSSKGQRQAKAIARFFRKKYLEGSSDFKSKNLTLLSSPKKRCIQTLEPLSELVKTKIKIEPLLDEEGPGETTEAFKKRIRTFLGQIGKEHSERIILCSHGDWLPTAILEMTDCFVDLKKGSLVEIDSEADGKSQVLSILQADDLELI